MVRHAGSSRRAQLGNEGLIYYSKLLREARHGQIQLPQVRPIAKRMAGASRIYDNIYDMDTGVGLYALVDPTNLPVIEIKYIGKGDVWDRRLFHRDRLGWEHLRQVIIAENNLTAREAAGLEQLLVERFDGPTAFGGSGLWNERWPLGINNPEFYPSIHAATSLLQEAKTILYRKTRAQGWH